MAKNTELLPGQSPPIAVITDSDHGGYILIANSLCLCMSLAGFVLRIHIRRKVRPPFSYDDIVLIVAFVRGLSTQLTRSTAN